LKLDLLPSQLQRFELSILDQPPEDISIVWKALLFLRSAAIRGWNNSLSQSNAQSLPPHYELALVESMQPEDFQVPASVTVLTIPDHSNYVSYARFQLPQNLQKLTMSEDPSRTFHHLEMIFPASLTRLSLPRESSTPLAATSELPQGLRYLECGAAFFSEWIAARLASGDPVSSFMEDMFPPALERLMLTSVGKELVPIWFWSFSASYLPPCLEDLEIILGDHYDDNTTCEISEWLTQIPAQTKLESIDISKWTRVYIYSRKKEAYSTSFPIPPNLPKSLTRFSALGKIDSSQFRRLPHGLRKVSFFARFEEMIPLDDWASLPKTLVSCCVSFKGTSSPTLLARIQELLPQLDTSDIRFEP
jgi:hypothetical protein